MKSASNRPCLLWFDSTLRLEDNPALQAALRSGRAVVPIYILAPETDAPERGRASRWWLHHALADLKEQLLERGLRLILRHADPLTEIPSICAQTNAAAVYANCHYVPAARARQQQLGQRLEAIGVQVSFEHNADLLLAPEEVLNKSGTPFQVFTPYWRNCCNRTWSAPVRVDLSRLQGPVNWPASLDLEALALLPKRNWDAGFYTHWTPTRAGAIARLKQFVASAAHDYSDMRDIPAADGTSRLSAWLHFGQIGVREIVAELRAKALDVTEEGRKFMAELGWREFSYYLLHHHPQLPYQPLRAQFAAFPWRENPRLLQAWQRGVTGYPLVDAGMRQLWHTGWMHNRLRMVVASFLVKNLLQPWQAGARWFEDTLVDADLASNTQGWQWSAGCGADAAPYFRVFNPVAQGERFDPEGEYVRRWVPQLQRLPQKYIHRPWEAPASVLSDSGITLGKDYPEPVVGLMEGRIRALNAYESFRAASKQNNQTAETER